MNQKTKKLILFVHGLGSSIEGGFEKFPTYLEQDAELARDYDVESFEYETAKISAPKSLSDIAHELREVLLANASHYNEIVFLCHSQGGLIVKKLLVDNHHSLPPIISLYTFGTPHLGSFKATLLPNQTWNKQLRDLGITSEFIYDLTKNWVDLALDNRVTQRHFVAENDEWVHKLSAAFPTGQDQVIIVKGQDHSSIVKPKSANAPIVLMVANLIKQQLPHFIPKPQTRDYIPPILLSEKNHKIQKIFLFIECKLLSLWRVRKKLLG